MSFLGPCIPSSPGWRCHASPGDGSHGWIVLAIGFVVSFVVALGVVEWFLIWVRRHGFVIFAVYRIILGSLLLAFGAKLAGA